MREIEPYLGDFPGEPLPPIRSWHFRQHERRGWVETITGTVPAILAAFLLVLLVVGATVLAAMYVSQARAEEFTEAQIRSDCRWNALRFCHAEAMRCKLSEDAECHYAIINCMIAHKASLSPKCARHIHD